MLSYTFAFYSSASSQNKGYVGKLPDIAKDYNADGQKTNKPVYEYSEDFNSANEIKPVPRENPAFVNIILKSDKTSQYVNDINEIIPILENLYDIIENDESLQLFAAKVYFLNKNCDWLREKYLEKPESSSVSFQKLMELNLHTRSVSILRTEAVKYNPYLAYGGSGSIYEANNINQQLEYLKTEIEETIVVLKDAK